MITIDHFRWAQTGDPTDALEFMDTLAEEGILHYKSPQIPDEDPEEFKVRQKADTASIVTAALANSSAAFRGALALKLWKVVIDGDFAMTTSAAVQTGITKREQLFAVFLDDTFATSGMSQAQVSRLTQFLMHALPALKEAGAEITPEHIIGLLDDEGGVTISSAVRAVGTIAKQQRGKLSKEQADYLADVVAKKIPDTEREIKEKMGMSSPTEAIIQGYTSITNDGTTLTFPNLTDNQLRIIVARLRGYAECEGWEK